MTGMAGFRFGQNWPYYFVNLRQRRARGDRVAAFSPDPSSFLMKKRPVSSLI
jgi:hypothetical protein